MNILNRKNINPGSIYACIITNRVQYLNWALLGQLSPASGCRSKLRATQFCSNSNQKHVTCVEKPNICAIQLLHKNNCLPKKMQSRIKPNWNIMFLKHKRRFDWRLRSPVVWKHRLKNKVCWIKYMGEPHSFSFRTSGNEWEAIMSCRAPYLKQHRLD